MSDRTPSNVAPTRRALLSATLATGAAAALGASAGCASSAKRSGRPAIAGGLAGAEPVPHVRFGMIGTGDRGTTHVRLIAGMSDAEVVAVADPHGPAAQDAVDLCRAAGKPAPTLYTRGDLDYRRMLERDDLDAVVISTPWRWHEPQTVEALRAGKHALVEGTISVHVTAMILLP